jgi:hypothetical protein
VLNFLLLPHLQVPYRSYSSVEIRLHPPNRLVNCYLLPSSCVLATVVCIIEILATVYGTVQCRRISFVLFSLIVPQYSIVVPCTGTHSTTVYGSTVQHPQPKAYTVQHPQQQSHHSEVAFAFTSYFNINKFSTPGTVVAPAERKHYCDIKAEALSPPCDHCTQGQHWIMVLAQLWRYWLGTH